MLARALASLLAVTFADAVIAQTSSAPEASPAPRSAANVVTQAEDAFGFRAGPEDSGLYDSGDVRGFDPFAAGNIRVQGLYADLQGVPSDRLSPQSTVRVGATTLGSLLPAPSGLVDYALAPANSTSARVRLARESFGLLVAEADLAWRSADARWSLAGGGSLSSVGDDFRGTRPRASSLAAVVRWRGGERLGVTAFHDRSKLRRQVEPFYYTAGDLPPPRLERGTFLGQPWSDYAYTLTHSGLLADAVLARGLTLRAGVFRSVNRIGIDTFDLFEAVTPDGIGGRTAYLFPPQRYASTSGEALLAWRWGGAVRHELSAGFRGRRADGRYGGERVVDLGPGSIFSPGDAPAPGFPSVGDQTVDRTRQGTWIGHYRLQSRAIEVEASLARTSYGKDVAGEGAAVRSSRSQPLLYSALVGWRPSAPVLLYASTTRGLEASGIAPSGAVNRNEVLPAIVTRQREVGARGSVAGLRVAASAFEIEKPYASLGTGDLFALNGTVRHRGVEASLTGSVARGVDLLAGLVVLQGRVSGPLVDAELLSRVPIDLPARRAQVGVNVVPPSLPRLSLDAVVNYASSRNAKLDGSLRLPPYTTADVGLRYRLLADDRLVVRAQWLNLFDAYALTVASDEAYFYVPGRSFRLSATTQF